MKIPVGEEIEALEREDSSAIVLSSVYEQGGNNSSAEINADMFEDDTPNQWIEVDGARVHNSTLMKEVLSSTPISRDRIRCCRDLHY